MKTISSSLRLSLSLAVIAKGARAVVSRLPHVQSCSTTFSSELWTCKPPLIPRRMNEAQGPEAIHEEVDSRTSRADHLGQGFLADLGDDGLGDAFLAKMSKHRRTRASLFSLELKS